MHRIALLLTMWLAVAPGCQLVAEFDRDKIPVDAALPDDLDGSADFDAGQDAAADSATDEDGGEAPAEDDDSGVEG